MCNMCTIEKSFKETEDVLNRTVDIKALKQLQVSIYEEMGWFEEAEDVMVEISKLNEKK